MKGCPLCGSEAPDDAERCTVCPYWFSSAADDVEGAQTRGASSLPTSNGRPTGIPPMVVGWLCFAAAAILMLMSLGAGPEPYEVSYATNLSGNPYASPDIIGRVSEGYARQWQLQLASGAFFSLFLAFWSVGYIVHAISFLPGKVEDR